jgi:hypothetical protein
MPDEHKTLEQRVSDIEFNLKKLREEITTGTFPEKERLSLLKNPLNKLRNNRSKHRINRKRSRRPILIPEPVYVKGDAMLHKYG